MFSLGRLAQIFNAENNREVWLRRRLHFVFSLRSNLLVLDLTLDVLCEALQKCFLFLITDNLFLAATCAFILWIRRLPFPFSACVDFALAEVLLLELALAFRIIGGGSLCKVDLLSWLFLSSTTLVAVLATLVAVVVSALLLLLFGNGCLLEHLFLDLLLSLQLSVNRLALAPS